MIDTSATARNVTPAVFRKVLKVGGWVPGAKNFDIGSGKFHLNLTDSLQDQGVKNLPYDVFALPFWLNYNSLTAIQKEPVATVTISNLLNVCQTERQMRAILETAKFALADDGIVYITTYPGNRSGIPGVTRDGYQQNKRLSSYLPIVARVFIVQTIGGMIVATKMK